MSTVGKAEQVIRKWAYGNLPRMAANDYIPEGVAKALAKAGLLAPDKVIPLEQLERLAESTKAHAWTTDADSWGIVETHTGNLVVPIEYEPVDMDDVQHINDVRRLVALAPAMMHELIKFKQEEQKGTN